MMAERHNMIDEDESNNPHHEYVQATITLESEEVVKEIVNEPSLDDPLEESFAQVKFELDLDMVCEQAKVLWESTFDIRPENEKTTKISFPNTFLSAAEEEEKNEHLESVEHLKQIEPPLAPNLSNDKEMSTEAYSFITIPFEILHEPRASVFQCIKEPSYDKFVKDLRTQGHKFRNYLLKKILRSKQVGYQRW